MAEHGLTAKLVQLTEHYLSLHLHDNAVFMAERLVAMVPSETNRHLLATVLVHAGRIARACAVLRGSRSPANVYLLARYCISLGKFSEAENVLIEVAGLVGVDIDAQVLALQSRPFLLPNGSAGAFLLGWACQKMGRLEDAAKYYLLCLFLDPFNFVAYESLCKLGYYPHPAQAFSAARLTAAGGFADKPSAATGHAFKPPTVQQDGQQQSIAVPSPLMSPITPAAKLLLLSPMHELSPLMAAVPPFSAATAPLPPPLAPSHRAAATPTPLPRGGGGAAGVHTGSLRGAPPPSTLRAHPALAASLAAGGSADRFGYHAFDGEISPVPPEFQNDGTGLWSRVLGMGMAAADERGAPGGREGLLALRANGSGGGPHTEDFLRRPPDSAAAMSAVSAFGTPATAAAGAAYYPRFVRRGVGVGGFNMSGESGGGAGGGARSAVRPFMLPPGSAATVASSRGGSSVQQPHHLQQQPVLALTPATEMQGSSTDEEDATMLLSPSGGGVGAGGTSATAANFTGVSAIGSGDSTMGGSGGGWDGSTPSAPATAAFYVPGPAGIIMAGKRKARADLAVPHSAAGAAASAASSFRAPASGMSIPPASASSTAAASAAARPRSKRLSFSGVPSSGSGAGGFDASLAPLHSPAAASISRLRVPTVVHSPLRRLRSHSEVVLSAGALGESSTPSQGGVGGMGRGTLAAGAATATAVKAGVGSSAKPLMRAMSARHMAAPPSLAAAALKSGEDAAKPRGSPGVVQPISHRDTEHTTAPLPPPAPSVYAILVRGTQELLDLLRPMAFAVRHMAKYECEAVLLTLTQLPLPQADSPWALGLRGRARFEMGQHAEARVAFRLLRDKAPHRLDNLDVCSTVLWHLKAAPELAALSDELISTQPGESTTWVVAANRFALAKDHKRAVSALQRALQLDPFNVYAHTLLGHEQASLAQLDDATTHFQRAIALEHNHYNAWYGLGTVYFKNNQLELAELHYRRACLIHKQSPTLMCYLGMVLAANKRYDQALDQLNRASLLDPGNPQAEYQKALVFIAINENDLARRALLHVLDIAPGEPAVLMHLGKACKHLGLLEEAATHLNAAMRCCASNDKQSNIVKGMLQSLSSSGNDGDVVF